MVLSFCLSLRVLTGRCLIPSPTIILPLIQCLALLHWLPIGSCFGGMHWLHLPAGRIPAFLNKALTPPLTPALLLTWLPHITISSPLFGHQTQTLLGSNSLIWCGNNITQNTAQHDTTYRGNDGTAQRPNPQNEITGNEREIEMDDHMW